MPVGNNSATSRMAMEISQEHKEKSRYAVRIVLQDGKGRIDEQIWKEAKTKGFEHTIDSIQHARLELQRDGLVKFSGERRKTEKSGALSRVWVSIAPEAIASIPGTPRRASSVEARK